MRGRWGPRCSSSPASPSCSTTAPTPLAGGDLPHSLRTWPARCRTGELMGYSQKGSLLEMADPELVKAQARSITIATGVRLWVNIRERTPVAHEDEEVGGLTAQEMTDLRGGRKPGTLRDSIYRTPALGFL